MLCIKPLCGINSHHQPATKFLQKVWDVLKCLLAEKKALNDSHHSCGLWYLIKLLQPISNLQQFNLLAVLLHRFAERLRVAFAAFDDVFVEQRIEGHGIISVVARHAK